MRQSEAWILQAKSDLTAAKNVLKENDASTYCQALAKYQQVVEKSVKGMVAALNELGISQPSISGKHTLEHEINGLDALRRKPDLDKASINVVDKVIVGYKNDIISLCRLAPSGPKNNANSKDKLYLKNTEYPFNEGLAEGEYIAPAALDTFTIEEVKQAYQVIWSLHHMAVRFTSSLRRRR